MLREREPKLAPLVIGHAMLCNKDQTLEARSTLEVEP